MKGKLIHSPALSINHDLSKDRGRFITFEGSEGCGKSTQSKLLYLYLKRKGYRVIYLREPGGSKIGEKIRKILLDAKNNAMSSECELLLYMAARAQLANQVIKPALSRGMIVICDRFLDSTIAYQGYGLGLSVRLIKKMGIFATERIKPDLTILLDLSTRKGLAACGRQKDRIEKRSLAYHCRVRSGYLKLASLEPKRIKIVQVSEDKDKTQAKIRELILKYL